VEELELEQGLVEEPLGLEPIRELVLELEILVIIAIHHLFKIYTYLFI
jgi:hypothetical protein